MKRILITHKYENSLARLTENAEVEVLFFPTIETKPEKLSPEDEEKLRNLDSYDYLIFTSKNAVKHFFEHLNVKDFSRPANLKIAATGSATAKKLSTEYGITTDLLPEKFSAEGLLEIFPADLSGKKILLPASKISRDTLRNELASRGAAVDFVPLYDTRTRTEFEPGFTKEKISPANIAAYVFTSPSSFRGFTEIAEIENPAEYFAGCAIIPIGEVTATALEKKGVTPSALPASFTIDAAFETALETIKEKQ